MAELANRDELEENFAKKFGRVARRHMHEYREFLGNPPDESNVPPEFWKKVERETENELVPILLLIFGESAELHGWQGADMGLAAFGFASQRAGEFAKYWVESTQDRLAKGFDKIAQRNRQEPSERTIEDAIESNRHVPVNRINPMRPQQPTEEIDRDELDELLDHTFGPKRIETVAIDETTTAQHAGGESGVSETVGLSEEDIWKCDWRHDNVCEVCSPLDDQPRSVWQEAFPQGPPTPHPRCRCYIQYAHEIAAA